MTFRYQIQVEVCITQCLCDIVATAELCVVSMAIRT